jgi:hypothetical protein
MKMVELYGRVRYAVQIEGLSRREAARHFGIDPRTVAKMLAFSVPPGYRRRRPPARPKLDPFTGIIDGILREDEGIVNLSGRGMLVVSVAWQLGSGELLWSPIMLPAQAERGRKKAPWVR